MVNYYIGKINPTVKNFTQIGSNMSLQRCMNNAKIENKKFIAFKPSSSTANTNSLETIGTCYAGNNFDPIKDSYDPSATNLFEVYPVPDGNCTSFDSCIRNNAKTALNLEIVRLNRQMEEEKLKMQEINAKIYAINNNISEETAKQQLQLQAQRAQTAQDTAQLTERIALLTGQLTTLNSASSNANEQLADKNRLLATASTTIQKTNLKLDNVNGKINTLTQNIYENNIVFERRNRIVGTLSAIITILFIMFLLMIVYYGVVYVQRNYSNSFGNFSNFGKTNLGNFF